MVNHIIHLTSVHPRYDTRIFLKMCSSIAKQEEFQVSLVVADGNGNEVKNGVNIVDVGKLEGRINRIFKTTKRVLQRAIELDGDIYHLHDPELIPIGLKLKKLGKKVIFDSHEDVPKDILDKVYLNKEVAKIISQLYRRFENFTTSKFNAIIGATPTIYQKFIKLNSNTYNINNYPIIGELEKKNSEKVEKSNEIVYVGSIDVVRGIKEIITAMENFKDIKLNLIGEFSEEDVYKYSKKQNGWKNIIYHGLLNREKVADIMSISKVGLVTFHPVANHIEAQPNKMFEYMSAGLPVIASNFPLWREIVEGNKCGICVDPLNPKEIAEAIKYIIDNPKEAKKMGENGKKAVIEKYNWNKEEEKLIKLYKDLLK